MKQAGLLARLTFVAFPYAGAHSGMR